MRSAWFSVRAFVVVATMLGFGGVMCVLALRGNETALGALIADVSAIFVYYFASPSGAGGAPHGPTT